jgi:hypothetical protein
MELRRGKAISSAAGDKATVLVGFVNRRKTMTTISKHALIAAIAAAGIASPALAQSFDPEAGSGNVTPFSYAQIATQNETAAVRQQSQGKIAARLNGLHAFAMVPRAAAGGNANDPALTGGGSAGYNEMLQRF